MRLGTPILALAAGCGLAAAASARSLPEPAAVYRLQPEPVVVPAPSDAALNQIPEIAVAARAASGVSADAAAALSVAVRGASGIVQTRYDAEARLWTAFVAGRARAENEPLVAGVSAAVAQCLRALSDRPQRLAVEAVLLPGRPAPADGEPDVTWDDAERGVAAMAAAFAADRCASGAARPDLSALAARRAALVVKLLVTGAYDPIDFSTRAIRENSRLLQPFVFAPKGPWAVAAGERLRADVGAALAGGLLSEATLLSVYGRGYESFVDWLMAVRGAQPQAASPLLLATARGCLEERVEALFEPFDLSACMQSGGVSLEAVKLGGALHYVIATKEE